MEPPWFRHGRVQDLPPFAGGGAAKASRSPREMVAGIRAALRVGLCTRQARSLGLSFSIDRQVISRAGETTRVTKHLPNGLKVGVTPPIAAVSVG